MNEKVIKIPPTLNNNSDSYHFLSELQNSIIEAKEDRIVLDFCECRFSHAIFTSFIGALTGIGKILNKSIVYKSKQYSPVYEYFQRSGLYNYMTGDSTTYTNSNAIPFQEIDVKDDTIINYIENILDLAPIQLTEQCHELLFKNIYEIFNNTAEHSGAKQGVYCCGHWMPKKRVLAFSLYDTGIGIPILVKNTIDKKMSSYETIIWALQRGNSTKQLLQGVPRGLGLADLHDFIRLNDGTLNIFSHDIYFECKKGNISHNTLSFPILGTFIGITIKADYEHIYTTQ